MYLCVYAVFVLYTACTDCAACIGCTVGTAQTKSSMTPVEKSCKQLILGLKYFIYTVRYLFVRYGVFLPTQNMLTYSEWAFKLIGGIWHCSIHGTALTSWNT